MVKCLRKSAYVPRKKTEDYEVGRRAKYSKFLRLSFAVMVSCCLGFLFFTSGFSLLWGEGNGTRRGYDSLCSSLSNGTLCCDRSNLRSDICVMKGDVRTDSISSSLLLYTDRNPTGIEKIRPYTRKWETHTMDTIDELNLILKPSSGNSDHRCDVRHEVPAVFFSTGGYTGNLYHEFNDGILPLYITSHHMNRRVVFAILEYHDWWFTKYGDVLRQLSEFPIIDFNRDRRVHCFPEATVGLKIHDELAIDPALMENATKRTMVDFHDMLDRAYAPRISGFAKDEETDESSKRKPKLVIVSRKGSREITNEASLVELAAEIGFTVEVLRPERTTELALIYWKLESSDVMVGVHGAAMTHFMFMRPKSVFIQVIPLGTRWPAENYYGEPARKYGLKYVPYEIGAKESSLREKYDRNDPVLVDPESVAGKGWEVTKKIYLDHQNVRLNLPRFRKRLVRAFEYCNRRRMTTKD
ncbi:glycosyltransferase [Genlisea aurea]|uniref:Glycosyltransferase n=1 Tax=Genlisea aurea TaxID=192259 RepID=S8DEF7_9LAMI|nr:glycosyltransferase [Genlisea aurea]